MSRRSLLLPSGGTVSPGTYGDASNVPIIGVNQFGTITSISSTAVSGGGGSSIYTLTAVVDGDFTWRNQGGASKEASNGHVAIIAPTGTANLRIREKNVPSAPYTIVLGFIPMLPLSNYYSCGLVLVESGTGKCVTARYATSNSNWGFDVSKWSAVTSYDAQYGGSALTQSPNSGMVFIKLVDDNTNRKCSVSFDGVNFWQIHTVGRTDYITPDKVGFFVDAETATPDGIATFYSWAQS